MKRTQSHGFGLGCRVVRGVHVCLDSVTKHLSSARVWPCWSQAWSGVSMCIKWWTDACSVGLHMLCGLTYAYV